LNEAAALTESVDFSTAPFESSDSIAVSQQLLTARTAATLERLSTIRFAPHQALTGSAPTTIFRSEFAVRGAGFDRVGLYLDGVLTETLCIRWPEDIRIRIRFGNRRNTVDSVSLMSDRLSAKYAIARRRFSIIQTREVIA